MCRQIKCNGCGKITWEGCGRHVKEVLKDVPKKSLCLGWKTKQCPEKKSCVVNIKYKNLKKIIKSDKIWMIKFYYPGCFPCKKLSPIWEKIAKKFKNNDKIKFGKINCYTQTKLCDHFSIEYFPVIKCFYPPEKKTFIYKGKDNYRSLYRYSKKKIKQYYN